MLKRNYPDGCADRSARVGVVLLERRHRIFCQGVEVAFLLLVVALPLDEVFPLAASRAVPRPVAVADDQEGVVYSPFNIGAYLSRERKR
jgi:hypothetical protein